MLSTRDAETLRALSRQERPSTGAEIGRRLKEFGVIENYARAHQLLDGLRGRELAASEGGKPQRWTITEKGRKALEQVKPTLESVLADYHVRIVPLNVQREPRDTHAIATLQSLWNDGHGETHLRDVLTLILESENNGLALTRHILTATSKLLKAHPDWWRDHATKWLEVYDQTNLQALEEAAKRNRAAVSVPAALTHELYCRLSAAFGPASATLFEMEKRRP